MSQDEKKEIVVVTEDNSARQPAKKVLEAVRKYKQQQSGGGEEKKQDNPSAPQVYNLTNDPEMYFLPMPENETHLILPYACGISSWLPKARLRRKACSFFSMELVLEGEGQLSVEDKTYSLTKGDVFLLHFNESHTYWNSGTGRWKKAWISFRHSLLTPGLEQLGLNNVSKISLSKEDFIKIRGLFFEVLDEIRDRNEDFRITSAATCYRILHLLSRHAVTVSANRSNAIPAQVQAVVSYAEKNLRNPISMEDLAQVAGCCRVHLTRLFKKHMGIHTRDWLIQLRMRHACMMLKTTNLPVHLIAEEVGFDDPYHFSTAFRRTIGLPPSQYRKLAKNGTINDSL